MTQTDREKNITALRELRERTMKITEALYRTTDLFSDAEPLKWSLRENAVQILNTLSDISSEPTYQELRGAQALEKMINTLCYKLDLAAGGTFIAKSNFDILEREYKALSEQVAHGELFAVPLLTESFAKSYKPLLESGIMDKQEVVVQKSPINTESAVALAEAPVEIKIESKPPTVHHVAPIASSINNVQSRAATGAKTGTVSVLTKLTNSRLSDRQNSLLRIIKDRGSSSVGDLTPLVGGSISEKTIQRDLNALADAGMLRREGEKRWRRYYL